MIFVGRFLCVAATYVVALSLISSPGIGTLTTASFFSLIFCATLALVEGLVKTREFWSFVIANVTLTVLIYFIQSSSAQNVKFLVMSVEYQTGLMATRRERG
jgi:hypothetical protein